MNLICSPPSLSHCLIQVSLYLIHLGQVPVQDFLSSNLVVGQQCAECDCEQSSLSFHLLRWNTLSWSLGGSWPDSPWAALSCTAFPLPSSGGTMSYSNSTLLVQGDSCAPASNPPHVGGGFVVASQSTMPLVLSSHRFMSSWSCLSGSLLTALPCYCATV